MRTVTLYISEIKRLNNSINGNPRYRLYYGEGRSNYYTTKTDASVNYDIWEGLVGKHVRLAIERNRVVDLSVIEDD